MKLNGDEKRIQQLFREMSCDERPRAPEFPDVLAAAKSGTMRSGSRGLILRLAMAVALLFAVLMIAAAIFVRPSRPQGGAAEQASAPAVPHEQTDSQGPSRPDVKADDGYASRRQVTKRVRRRRDSDQMAFAVKSLFAWQSPTTSLLTTPHDQLLNSLPRLGESLQMIKAYSPEQFN